MTRLATGIPGFDAMVQGGLPLGSSVILQGPPGQEKLQFALTFLAEGLKAGASGVLVISSQSPDSALAELRRLGVDLDAVTTEGRLRIVDWYSWSEETVKDVEERGIVHRSSVDLTNLGVALSRAIAALTKTESARAVIEMLSPATNVYEITQVYAFAQSAKKKFDRFGFTSLVLLEKDMHAGPEITTLHQPFDGVIEVERTRTGDRIVRKIGVLHLKDTAPDPTFRILEMTEFGLRVVRETSPPAGVTPSAGRGSGTVLESQEERARRLTLIMQIAGERLNLNPKDADALFAMAAARATLDDPRGALESLERLAELDPSYPGLWVLKTKLHARLGDAERARQSRARADQADRMEASRATSTVPCPMCEAPVAADATMCASCGVTFAPARKLEDELEDLGKAAIQDMVSEELGTDAVPPVAPKDQDELRSPPSPKRDAMPAPKPAPTPQLKKGLTNGLVLSRGAGRLAGMTNGLKGRTNGLRGRTNGLTKGLGRTNGLTNGLGRTNGLTNGLGRTNGLTNGLGRTNGLTNGLGRTNGLTNGLGRRPSGFRGTGFRSMMQTAGWKLYVIPLVVVGLLLMPLFTVPAYNGPSSPIRIDGQFTDWASVSTEAMTPGSVSNPNIDIVRFGVMPNLGPVAFYVEVAGSALAGGGPTPGTMDSFRIFVDIDGSASTGYRIDGLGADRMIEISGYGGTILSSTLWEFDANRNPRDWNGWIKGTATPAAAGGSRIEAEAEWISGGPSSVPTIATVHATSWNGQLEAGDFPASPGLGTLSVTTDPLTPSIIAGSGVPLLRLTLSAHGQPFTVSSVQIQVAGTAPATAATSLRLTDGAGTLAQVTPTSRNATFSFAPLAFADGTTTTLSIVGDFASSTGETFGIRLPATHPFGLGAGVVSMHENPATRDLGYLGFVPAGPRVDGAFEEWTSLSLDGTADVGPRANPNIDLGRYGAQRSAGSGSTFLYTDVTGRILSGTPTPEVPRQAPQQSQGPADTDRDGVPDLLDPYPLDFNNDGIPDAQTNGDYDGDGVIDYGFPGGTDAWLNTTIPTTFPAPYAGRSVSVYIGPDNRPPSLGEDAIRIFLDLDNSTFSGYSIGGVGADRLVEIRGKDGAVTQAALLVFSGSFPGDWAWSPISPVTVAVGYHAVELAVSLNASRMYVESSDFWGSVDSTTVIRAFAPLTSSFKVSPASAPLDVPWQQSGPQTAGVIDPNSNAVTTVYNQQRKVVRAGDVAGQTACDATNSDGCWYVVFHDQVPEVTSTTAASTETATTGYRVSGTFPTDIQSQDGTFIQYRESAEGMLAYRSNTGSNGGNSLKTRTWDGGSWKAEVEQATAGSPLRAVRMAYSPTSPTERIVVTLSDDGWLDAYVCTPTCTVTNNVGQVWSTAPSNAAIPFDIAYEQVSGDALLVYGVLSANTAQDFAYRVYTGGSWGAEQYVDDTTETTDITYTVMKLAPRLGSDQIGLVGAHTTPTVQANAWIWSGTAFGNFDEIDTSIQSAANEEVAIGWESNSGHLLAVAIDSGVPRVSYALYTTSWSGYFQSPDCAVGSTTATWVRLKPNPLSTANDMILAMGGNGPRLGTCYWDGTQFVNGQSHDAAIDSASTRAFDFAWEATGSRGLLVWGTTAGQITYRTFTAPNTWGTVTNAAMGASFHVWVTLRTNPSPRTGATKILGVAAQSIVNDLGSLRWDGSTFTVIGSNDLSSDIVSTTYENFALQYQITNSDQLSIRYDWSGVPAGGSYALQVEGYREDEGMNVQVLTPPSSWNTRLTISATSNTLYSYTLTASEYNSGAPAIRFVDAAGAVGLPSDLFLDYVGIATTSFWDRVAIMRSSDTAGSTWGSQVILASGRTADSPLLYPRDSTEPSIAIDSAGFLHVVWVSASSGGDQNTLDRVRYARTTVAYPTQAQLASAASWAFDDSTSYYPSAESVTTGSSCGGAFPADVQASDNVYRCYREAAVEIGALAYKSSTGGGVNLPKQLDWAGSSWGTPETELTTAGAPVENVRVVWDATSGSSLFWIALNTGANIHVYKCTDVDTCTKEDVDPSSGNDYAVTQAVGTAPERHWDIAEEMVSGELLLAYDNPAAVANDFCYRTRTAGISGTWSAESCFDHSAVTTTNPSFAYVVLTSNPGSNRIGFGAFDTTNDDFVVAVWDGTAWVNANKAVSTTVTPTNGWGGTVVAEDAADEFVAYASNGKDSVAECEWTAAGGWESTCATFDPDTHPNQDTKVITATSLPGTNEAMVCENADNGHDNCWEWDGVSGTGGTRGPITEHTTNDGSGVNIARPIGIGWNPDQSGTADLLAVYYDNTVGQLSYKTYDDAANTWTAATTFSSAGSHLWVDVIGSLRTTASVKALVVASNSNLDILAYQWSGSGAPASEQSITADTADETYPHWGFAFQAAGQNYRVMVRHDWSAIATDGSTYDACVEAHIASAGGESMLLQVLTPPSTWTTRMTVTKTADDNADQCYTLTASEFNAGAPSVRWIGGTESGDDTQSDINIDQERIIRHSVKSVDDASPGFMPTVSTDTGNNPHIAWSGSKTSGTVFYKNRAGGTWRPTVSWGTTYTGLSVDVSPQNNFVSLARYFESGTNEIQYTVCKDLSTSNCDASAEFTKWDGTAGYDTVATAIEAGAYPSLVTTYDANGDLWIAYAKDVDGSTRAIYARFLDYPSNGFQAPEVVDSLSGTQFTRPSIGVDKDGTVHALYVALSGPQLYYDVRTGGTWGSRTAIDSTTDHPSLTVRAPNDIVYGTTSGAVYWKSTTSETYFYYVNIPEFETVVGPIFGILVIVLLFWRRARVRPEKTSGS